MLVQIHAHMGSLSAPFEKLVQVHAHMGSSCLCRFMLKWVVHARAGSCSYG